jgi:hypothetical protein
MPVDAIPQAPERCGNWPLQGHSGSAPRNLDLCCCYELAVTNCAVTNCAVTNCAVTNYGRGRTSFIHRRSLVVEYAASLVVFRLSKAWPSPFIRLDRQPESKSRAQGAERRRSPLPSLLPQHRNATGFYLLPKTISRSTLRFESIRRSWVTVVSATFLTLTTAFRAAFVSSTCQSTCQSQCLSEPNARSTGLAIAVLLHFADSLPPCREIGVTYLVES